MAQIFQRKPGDWPTRGYLLYFAAMPLIPAIAFSLARGNALQLLAELAGLLGIAGGGWLIRRGIKANARRSRYSLATGPSPLSTAGSVAAAFGTFICSYFLVGQPLVFGLLIAALTLLGCHLAYVDPRTAQDFSGAGSYSAEEVAELLGEADQKISGIEKAAGELRQVELSQRLRRIAELGRKVLERVEQDPRDLRRARKFLNVYLDGARSVSEGYAKTHKEASSAELEQNFRNVLTTIEEVFDEQHTKLLENDVLDLDIKIEVLDTQLKREGVA